MSTALWVIGIAAILLIVFCILDYPRMMKMSGDSGPGEAFFIIAAGVLAVVLVIVWCALAHHHWGHP